MESYGSYETSREIASGRGSTVFAAVRKGEATGQFAVKIVFSAPVSDDPFADAAAPGSVAAEAFLNSVAIQKKAAASSPCIAPILEDGIDPRGAWSVTPFYPRSVQKLIEGRVALNQAGVFHILQAIVAGLLGMKKSCGRSHGRLHAGNVLIGAGATLGDAPVHLTDCAPDGIEPGRCELADLRAVGLILYQLVRKREVREDDDWVILPLEASKEWTDLFGASTGAWLEIGNALLDRNLSLDHYSLEKLSSALVALQPKPPVSRRTLVLAAAAVLLGVAGLLFFVWSSGWATIQIAIVGPGGVDGPGDARVMVDGQPAKSKPPTGSRRQFKLRKNRSYEFAVSHGDLVPFKTNVIVDGRSGQSLELPLVFGNLVVEGVTPGAEFALTNGATVITGNTTKHYTNAFAKPGLWQLALKREGFVSAVLETNVQAGQTSVLQALLKARDPGKVLVEFLSSPGGATVAVIDGGGNTIETVKTGEGMSEIKPGKYTLSASYPFWDRRQVQTIPFEILLQPDRTNVTFVFSNVRFALACEDPPGATVTVTNRFLGEPSATNFMTTTPVSLLNWPTGMFVFHFEAAGYLTTNLTVTLLAGATQVTARLIPMLGFADLRTDLPAFITNVVNGECIATNLADIPNVIELKPGKNYKLRATPQGFPGIPPVEMGDLTFEKGQTNLVPFKFAFRRVALTSDPAGAEMVDPFGTNAVPVTSLSVLPLGTTTLTARHPRYGFDPETEPVPLVRGRTIPVQFKFKYGTVIVTSFPSGLVVRGTNGQSLGRTPYTNSFAPYGTATYQILNTNQQPRKVEQKVAARTTYYVGHDFTIPDSYTNRFKMEFEFVPQAGIYVGRFEVTEGNYAEVMGIELRGTNPHLPTVTNSYREAVMFVAKLNQQDRDFLKAYLPDGELHEYGLPRDKEWRAFAPTSALEEDPDAVFRVSGVTPERRPVNRPRNPGTRARLFDLYGNVEEWCEGANGQPVARGGAFNNPKASLTVVRPLPPGEERFKTVGLRCVLRRK